MEKNLDILLSEIEEKATKLNKRMQRLESENAELRASVFNYIQQLDEAKHKLTDAETQLKSAAISSKQHFDNKELKKELDKYILLIDRCIASLHTKL